MCNFFSIFFVLFVACTPLLNSSECSPHYFVVGPECYQLKRSREGGTRQRGTLGGVRASYDYIRRYKFYLGCEAAYAQGILKGRSGNKQKLRSRFSDAVVEGRLGYTFQTLSGCGGWFTPFIGGGYFWENNNYLSPSPKKVHFSTRYGYFALGAYSGTPLTSQLEIGLNATARFCMQGKMHISHDPEGDPLTLKYEQKVNCRVVLPLTYFYNTLSACLAPFYEYRHYGRRHAFPFDFLDTRIKVYGIDLFLVFNF